MFTYLPGRVFRHLTLLTIFLFSIGLPIVSAQDPPPEVDELPVVDPRFGVVDSFVNNTEAGASGAGWTRVFFRWDVVQQGGQSDWKPANVPDPLLEAEVQAGREVVGVLIGTPAWATESGSSTAVPPRELWGDFVFKIASQYQGRVQRWVIWNQPDVTDPASPNYTWDGTEEDYYLLLKEAYQKIKAVDPNMTVHLAGLTYTWDQQHGNRQYLTRLLEVMAADPEAAQNNYFFDAVSYHLYYNPNQMLNILTDVHSILDAAGQGHKPIWINETNAPPSDDFIEPALGVAPYKISLEEQSAFVIQAMALSLAGGAERIAFYRLRNARDYSATGVPLGLLRGDNSRRPAFEAFRAVTTYFAGVQQTSWVQLGNVYIVTLQRDGLTTTVLWNTDRNPTRYTLNAIAPQAVLVDMAGNPQTISANNGGYTVELAGAACTNGEFCFIGGPPLLIVETGSAEQRAPLLPLVAPSPTPNPLPTPTPLQGAVLFTPAPPPAPPPTLTPTPQADSATVDAETSAQSEPTSAATISPTPDSEPQASPPAVAMPAPAADDTESAPPADAILPDPEFDPFAAADIAAGDIAATPTIVPAVGISTIFRPERLLWLFLIGVVVFTVTYGIQVAIWYRLRR